MKGINIMLFMMALAAIVLLNLVGSYTFIHILLGTATFCVVFRLVYGFRLPEELPDESCARLLN